MEGERRFKVEEVIEIKLISKKVLGNEKEEHFLKNISLHELLLAIFWSYSCWWWSILSTSSQEIIEQSEVIREVVLPFISI